NKKFAEETWSIYLLKDAVRVLPLDLTQEQREQRQAHSFKLAGLPRNTTACDLHEIIMAVNAQSCFIPKNPRIESSSQDFSLNGHELYWCSDQQKTCHKCGSPDHLAKA
ncbi:4862_t:CDS:2, partial [Entrophospora sp. SA101]